MPDTIFPTDADSPTSPKASQHFATAVEQAKAGAAALGKQAQGQADAYREKLTQHADAWTDQAKDRGDDALVKVKSLAVDGKTRASGALQSAGKFVEDNAALVDDKVGATYGDYVRTAGRSLQDLAERLDAKDIDELSSEVQAFVRERPALSIGIAAASGIFLSRLFMGSKG